MVPGGSMKITRRECIAAMVGTAALHAKPLGLAIGCQTYPVRNEIGTETAKTLAQLHADGFETIEMCSPHSYREFLPLGKMSGPQLRNTIETAGLRCESCHYGWRELKENLDERIAYAKALGLKQMVLSTFGLPATATLADWSRAAEEMNGVAEKIQK